MRPIDAVQVLNDINWHHKPTPVSEFESGFNRGLNQAMWIITHAPTLAPPNEPLTLDGRLTSKMVTCPKGWQGVRNTRFYCPGCKKAVKKDEAYCHKCGQALIFPVQRYDKENNRIWLDFSDRRPPEGAGNA